MAWCWSPTWATIMSRWSIRPRAMWSTGFVTGKGAHNLFLSPDNKILWVNNRAGGTTTALDAQTLKV